MKNMKKTIIGVAILAIALILMMTGSVNAASLTANNAEVKKGETVTVTINTEEEAQAVEFVLKYDATKFEYIDGSATTTLGAPTINATEKGIIRFVATNATETTNKVDLQFKALETTEEAVFTASNFLTDVETEELQNTTVAVKVVEETPVTPEDPDDTQEPTDPETPGEDVKDPTDTEKDDQTTNTTQDNADEKVGTDGKVIEKLPQTGTSIFTVVGAILAVAGIVFVVRKNIKK